MKECLKTFCNPIVFIAVLIVVSTVCLITATVFGYDRGFLVGMAKSEYARGLITYLFAVVTIVTAVSLGLYGLTSSEAEAIQEKRFQRGKEIFALLLGIFGTMVGFYFGSEAAKGTQNATPSLEVSSLDLSPQPIATTDTITIRAVVKGGTPPYRYGIIQGKSASELTDVVAAGGWIVKQLRLTATTQGESQSVHVVI